MRTLEKLCPNLTTRTNLTAAEQEKAALYDKHFSRFWGGVGSLVVFKRPKRPKEIWMVDYVELDFKKVKWSHGGLTPNYIKLREVLVIHDQACAIQNGKECWTCENKIRPYKER